jgi:hypothetical protein
MSRFTRFSAALIPILLATTLVPTPAAHATFPGDTGLVAFVRNSGGASALDIWTMNPDGTNQVQLTSTSDSDFTPAWSPDGSEIVFVRCANPCAHPHVWLMNADGSSPHQLTTVPDASDQGPKFSPDGAKIVFSSTRDDTSQFHPKLFVMNPDGSGVDALTEGPSDSQPDWSPDGQKIAFIRDVDLWVMNADGSNPVNLTNSPASDVQPAWWPDGSKIVFSSSPASPNVNYDLDTIPAAGGTPTPLFSTPPNEFHPSPTPDGTAIFFDTNGPPPTRALTPAQSPTGADCDKVNGTGTGGVTIDADCTSPSVAVRPPKLVINKTGYEKARVGEKIEWIITVQNFGGYAKDVAVSDFFISREMEPVGRPISSSGDCEDWVKLVGWSVTCGLGDLATDEVRVVHVTTRVLQGFLGYTGNLASVYLGTVRVGEVQAAVRIVGCASGGSSSVHSAQPARSARAGKVIEGTPKGDVLCGTPGSDVIYGKGGNDKIYGLGGSDTLYGGPGTDKLVGGPGSDRCIQNGAGRGVAC